MERRMFWKSALRRTVSLLLLLALIATASFGFVLRTLEYLTVNGEIERISKNYHPIGTLSVEGDEIAEGIEVLKESPYLDFVDERRYCPAILSEVYNSDLDGGSSDRDREYDYGVRVNDILAWAEVEGITETAHEGVFRYDFRVKEAVYGYPDYVDPKNKLTVLFDSALLGEELPVMEEGKTYLVKGGYSVDDNFNTGTVHYSDGSTGKILSFRLLPLEENRWFLEGQPEEAVAERYVDADAPLQERNRHAMIAVTSADMSAMPEVQESANDFYLEDGRWPNREDSVNGNKVCAVSAEFAGARGLQVGDTLAMTLQDRIPTYLGYVTNADEDTWDTCDRTEVEMEIVGIYGRMYGGLVNDPYFAAVSSRSVYIYIPDGCLPDSYVAGEQTTPDSFSFVLSSPKEKEAFEQETGQALGKLGISYSFVENHWDTYYSSAKGIEQGAAYNFAVFAAVLVFALSAVAFLYLWQRKKEIAIARALGVPAGRAAFGACVPMLVLGAFGILAGALPAWRYGSRQAEQTLAELASGGRAGLSGVLLIAVCLLLWLALLLMLFAGSLVYARRPVLEILQGNAARTKEAPAAGTAQGRSSQSAAVSAPAAGEQAAAVGSDPALAAGGNPMPFGGDTVMPAGAALRPGRAAVFSSMARFLWRHIRRFSVRSACALLTAAVFVTASGWLGLTIRSSGKKLDKMYDSVSVHGEITRADKGTYLTGTGGAFIHRETVQQLVDTGFVEEMYLEAAAECRLGKISSNKTTGIVALGIADAEQFLAKDWNSGLQIQYMDGYGPELFAEECKMEGSSVTGGNAAVVSEALWEERNLHPGDVFYIESSNGEYVIGCYAAGVYTGEIAGAVDTVLVPLSFMELLEKENLNYRTAQFVVDSEKNRELAEFRDAAKEIVGAPGAGGLNLSLVLWDNELRQVVEPMEKNIRLMKLLYPVANIVSFLIAGGLAVLLLFQRRREAAILRVLGVGAVPVRLTLAFELWILTLVGILLGLCAVGILTGTVSLPVLAAAALAYFAGSLIGAVIAGFMVTGARPLELLQVKE